jgi:hypothetical protein
MTMPTMVDHKPLEGCNVCPLSLAGLMGGATLSGRDDGACPRVVSGSPDPTSDGERERGER